MSSKSFGSKLPVKAHLVVGPGGISAEVLDLRKDVEEAFVSTETPGHGGTSIYAVEEWVNPAAKSAVRCMTSKNFTASAQVLTGASLTGTTMSPPRNLVFTVTIGAGVGAGTMTATGIDVDGNAIHEHFTVPAGSSAVIGTSAFAKVTQVDLPAIIGGAFAGSVTVGDGDLIGLGDKAKLRNTVVNALLEMVDGVVIGGGGVAATATNIAEAAHTHPIAGATPLITASKLRKQQSFGALAAAGTNYVAQYAAGAAIDDAVGPFTRFVPPRTVRIVRGGAGVATVYTITGTDADGNVITDTITTPGAGTVEGVRAFTTITRVQSDVNPTVTTDVRTGVGFGLACEASDIDAVGVDGVLEAPSSSHAATGTVVPTTAPNAAHVYTVDYRVLPAATQAAHDHGAATGAGAAHNHTQNAHSHGGTSGTLAGPAVGAPHGTYAPATIPNGAHDYCLVYERDLS